MSNGLEELRDALRASGQRLTPQRMMVLSALADGGGHMTAEAIFEFVRVQYPYANLSTVYRTLELLVALGLAAETDLGSGVREFELVGTERHHHLICQHCGSAEEISDELFQPLRERLIADFEFTPRMDHFAIFGLCRDCRATGNNPAD